MAVRLEAVDAGAFRDFAARARETYERQMVDFGRVDPDEARSKAETDTARLFPDDRPAEGVHVYSVVDDGSGADVGIVFFASLARGAAKIAFIYGIEIDEGFRGRGFGRAAMLATEAKARELGHVEMRLNVFGGNEAARGLYRSLDYEEVDVTMVKPLASSR